MLTGDNQFTADAIAQQVGIDQARGDLLPEDKLKAVEIFGGEGVVGMVGDGINDAPHWPKRILVLLWVPWAPIPR